MSDMGDENLYHYVSNFGPVIYDNLRSYICRRAYRYAMGSRKKLELLDKLMSARSDCSLDYDNHVLRNLTTKEYILASEMQKVQKRTGYYINFGNLLLCQISWSTNPSTSFRRSYNIHRGRWAGHRFDITSIDKVDRSWKDVSTKVLKRYGSIYDDDDA
ncbi:hypothetical protein GGI23_006450 [Coemansia sp. RSA 2559]|nr:hypothetical protein GGI23_006450 [Coemansia sp. RSA 2559]